jgi:hypothetical protein
MCLRLDVDWERRGGRGHTLEVDADRSGGLHLWRRLLLLPRLGARSVAARRARDAVDGAPRVQLQWGNGAAREHHGVDLMRLGQEQQQELRGRTGDADPAAGGEKIQT